MIPNNDKAMPHDSLPQLEQMAVQQVYNMDSRNRLLDLESESASLMRSLQQHLPVQAEQIGFPAAQLNQRGGYSKPSNGTCNILNDRTVPMATLQHDARNPLTSQDIDKAVLRDICRLLGHAVVPQPHNTVGLGQPMSFIPSHDAYQSPQAAPSLLESQTKMAFPRSNTVTGFDQSSPLYAKIAKQVQDGQEDSYSSLLQQRTDTYDGQRGPNLMLATQTNWPSSSVTHGQNVTTSQQLLYPLGSSGGTPWNCNPSIGHSDLFGNIAAQGFQQLPTEGIAPVGRPKQILRALSAYNFFFRDERDRIVSETEGQYETSSEKKQQLLAGHWYRDRTKKRRHRKTHGKIAFTELSKVISQRWKDLPEDLKSFYREVASDDLMRYHRELENQKSLQDSYFDKRA